jgi:hypothetical protein
MKFRIVLALLCFHITQPRKMKIIHTMKVVFAHDDIVVLADKKAMSCNMCESRPIYIHLDNGYASAYCALHVPREIKCLVDKK